LAPREDGVGRNVQPAPVGVRPLEAVVGSAGVRRDTSHLLQLLRFPGCHWIGVLSNPIRTLHTHFKAWNSIGEGSRAAFVSQDSRSAFLLKRFRLTIPFSPLYFERVKVANPPPPLSLSPSLSLSLSLSLSQKKRSKKTKLFGMPFQPALLHSFSLFSVQLLISFSFISFFTQTTLIKPFHHLCL
jgi:hypothetical protein